MAITPLKIGGSQTSSVKPLVIGAKPVAPQAPTDTITGLPQNAPKLSDDLWGTLAGVSHGAAKGAIKGIIDTVGLATKAGGVVEKGLDAAVNQIPGVHSNTAAGAKQGAADLKVAGENPAFAYNGTSEKVGGAIGQVADALVTPPGRVAGKGAEIVSDLATTAVKDARVAKTAATEAASMQDALDITKPVLNKAESIRALERSGQAGGGVDKGFSGYKVAPSPRDERVAASVQDIVSRKAGPIDNIANINQKIGDISEREVRPFLQANPSPFNIKTLNAYIRDNAAIPNYIKADPVLQRTYDLTRDAMVEEASHNPKTLEGLWDSRISFDDIAERQAGSLDPNDVKASVIRQAVLDTRRAVNDFIAENAVGGDAGFKAKMRLMTDMYHARANIAESNYKLLDKNAITRWMKLNPAKAELIRYGVGAAGIGGIGALGVSAASN